MRIQQPLEPAKRAHLEGIRTVLNDLKTCSVEQTFERITRELVYVPRRIKVQPSGSEKARLITSDVRHFEEEQTIRLKNL